jgi:rhamnose utilization protein RhaD (predicted bifunctional aldolase and dehydrogenase)/NAD(P)-dependent dehydrogenase (short-subunit alcohol dehydrogenase family)
MQSRWDATAAAQCPDDLALRVYSSRLLGAEPALVLHGGGNTSVKVRQRDIFGDVIDLLYVKGSGSDLATIDAAGFTPLRLAPLLRLAALPALDDATMVNELRCVQTSASAPTPSVETLLHAVIPARFVDHTHADALIVLMNAPDGAARIRAVYGDDVIVVPYVMPGFLLARACAAALAAAPSGARGMVLMHHGVFTWGDSAAESYARMLELVTQAEAHLQQAHAWELPEPPPAARRADATRLATLRQALSHAAGAPLIMSTDDSPEALAFAARPDVALVSQQGCATPDHIIRTRRIPLLGDDVASYVAAYHDYFARHAAGSGLQMLDPAPRVVLDAAFGLASAGRTLADARATGEIYRQTMTIIGRAVRLGGWQALPERDLFDIEYWELEQAKLKRRPTPPALTGEIALVTGAASGIGRACVDTLLARGAAVVALDIDPRISQIWSRREVLAIQSDVTDDASVVAALDAGVLAFGGLDLLVLNAGIFPASRRIAELRLDEWQRSMRINLDANAMLLRAAHPLLARAPRGGRVVVVGSKNVPAPGPGAAAYSSAKAALTQLARVAALEWASDGIRVNVVHPNAVFDTGLWSEDVLAARAASYGMSVGQYRSNNLLRTEIRSRDVAELVAEMCGPVFARTTGAQIPIDGGNERVI